MDVPLLEVENLHVQYGRITALKGVSIKVWRGEIVSILGANGAGKSTFMRALAVLQPIRRGTILLSGKSIVDIPAYQRSALGISFVAEGRSVFGPLTVEQNLRLGLLPRGFAAARKTLSERAAEVMKVFPALKNRTGVRAGELSGGQQQMLAIGRALMSEPQLLLLDEPSLGLAPIIIEELFGTLVELNERTGLTVVLCEQNIDNALAIADRGYVFEVGELALTDDAESLRHRAEIADVYLGRRAQGR